MHQQEHPNESITISDFVIDTRWALDRFKQCWKHRAPANRGEEWKHPVDWYNEFVAFMDGEWESPDYTGEEHY